MRNNALLALLFALILALPAFAADKAKVVYLGMGDMLPGLVEASAGGVVRIADLQSQGYVYIRP